MDISNTRSNEKHDFETKIVKEKQTNKTKNCVKVKINLTIHTKIMWSI